MKDLSAILSKRIRTEGPIRFDDYMQLCLTHTEYGYYSGKEPLGADGDFTTAPEISQMFGELIGLSLAMAWKYQNEPTPFTIAELGPGRGTLMADALRASKKVPGFNENCSLHLVETSHKLRNLQKNLIGHDNIVWHQNVETLPHQPLFLVANEFFDALPVRQVIRDGTKWRERHVGFECGKFLNTYGSPKEVPELSHRINETRDGDVVEFSPTAMKIAKHIGEILQTYGGVAIIVDYGDWRSLGDTIQSVRSHRGSCPLETPGTADISAHVDFEALATSSPSAHSRLTPQHLYLERLGINNRAKMLETNLTGSALKQHIAAHRRLTHKSEMGNLFKVMALYPRDAAPPPGLEK
ncbi:MAG: SAM-dependent methyltransferase [Roseovarius sp.]|nr:SAM-dependent methyltransferase [Roseovarius sp.]